MAITRERFEELAANFMQADPVGFVKINGWAMGCPVCHTPPLAETQIVCWKCGLRAAPPSVEEGGTSGPPPARPRRDRRG
jgi:hypothetical protein